MLLEELECFSLHNEKRSKLGLGLALKPVTATAVPSCKRYAIPHHSSVAHHIQKMGSPAADC